MLPKILTASLLIAIAASSNAQKVQAPPQLDILRAMREANDSFVGKKSDTSIYYAGLMGLYSIDPQKRYFDFIVNPKGPAPEPDQINDTSRILTGLIQKLSYQKVNDPERPGLIQKYNDLIQKAISQQGPDGYWNNDDLAKTALFTYGIAWGIREGYLEKKQYLGAVTKSWNAVMAIWPRKFQEYELGCFLLAGSELYQIATPPAEILDESKVPPYQETPLPLTTIDNWETVQRPAIYQLFEKNVYGRMPKTPIAATYTTEESDENALNGEAIKRLITIHFDTAASIHLMLYLPKKQKRAPVFVGYSFTPNEVTDTSSQWPIKTIIARGYGVAVAYYWDVEPDRADGWQSGIRTRLAEALHIQPYEWSAMGAWAWGLSRIVDYLETNRRVDSKRLIVIGHSRLGKAAIWAGAGDKRIALVVSNESGEGGAALGKRDYGETIAIINEKFPWWFSPAYKQYGVSPSAMPTDQFMLLSLIAPRPLYVASAVGDQNSDPKGEFLSATLAAPVYGLYHEKGVGTDSMPAPGHPVGDYIRYHIREGRHDMTLYDWQEYMNFADTRLKL
jgi:hypothetical protein